MQTSTLAIMAAGLSFVILMGDIDISLGSSVFFSGSLGAMYMAKGGNIYLGMLLVVACGALLGAINGIVVGKLKLNPMITTLAALNAYRGLGLMITNVNLFVVPPAARTIARGTLFEIPYPIIVMALVLLATHILATRTAFGKHVYAVGCDERAAHNCSINVPAVRILAYTFCGLCTGIAALIWVGRLGATTASLGQGMEFKVITAVVIGGISFAGGIGRILPNVLIGALVVTIIENGMNLIGLNTYLYDVVRGSIVFVAVFFDALSHQFQVSPNWLVRLTSPRRKEASLAG